MPISHVDQEIARAASPRPTHQALRAKAVEEFGPQEADWPPRVRRMVERSAFLINATHQAHIDERRAGVDAQDTEVGDDALALSRLAQDVRDALDSGEITAAQARGKLRDFFAAHRSMVDVSAALDAEDERLAVAAEQDPGSWQAAQLVSGGLRAEDLPSLLELESSS
jgi:hypothetical protein